MKKAKREKKRLPWWQTLIYSVIAAPFAAVAVFLGGLVLWMSFGAAIYQRVAKPSDMLNDTPLLFHGIPNPWRGKLPEQDGWRQIVQNSQFTLGEPLLEGTTDQKGWTTWKLSLPGAAYPNIDGSTVMVPMAVEFARQHLGMDAEQAGRFIEFSTTYYAYKILCERDEHSYTFRNYFEGVDYVSWDTGRPLDLLLGSPPVDAAWKLAGDNGVELVQKPVCRDAFVFITGADNPVESLTLDQVRGIFSGEITSWREVGGANQAIRAFQREEGSGSQLGMEELVMQGTPMADPKTVMVVGGMGGLIDAVAEYQNSARSIGYSYKYYIDNQYSNESIKQLKIEGVAPTNENIRNGSYPLSVEYVGVILKGGEKGPGWLFLDWILSEEGQACVAQAGYIPMNN